MLRAELFLVNLERVQIIRLGRFLPAGLSKNQRDVVEHCSQIGIRQIVELGPGRDRFLVITDRFFLLAEVVAQKREPAGRAIEQTLIQRFGFFENAVSF